MAKAKPEPVDPSLPLANGRWEIFAVMVSAGSPASTAYGQAGFGVKNKHVAKAAASRLLSNVNITARVEFLKNQAREAVVATLNLTRADVLRWTIEQHERNIGLRLVTHKRVAKTGKDKGKVIEVTTTAYDGKAAAQTLKMLSEEFGLGQGASGGNGTNEADRVIRGGVNSPAVLEAFDRLKLARERGLRLVGQGSTADAKKGGG